MKEEAIRKFLRVYRGSFPLKKKFNFTGFCKGVKSLIDEDYDCLLMKKKELSKNKKREWLRKKLSLEVNDINFDEKEILEKRKKNLLKKQKLMQSSYNNKMLLDLMLNNKKYIKYMTEKNSDNSKTRNKNNNDEKKEDSIKLFNNFTEGNICSRVNAFETIEQIRNKKSINFKNLKSLSKACSKHTPICLKKIVKQNNSFFKTSIQKRNLNNSKSLRDTLFNRYQKNNLKKYFIKSNLPTLNIDYNENNIFNETETKKNDESIKTFFNYNKSSRRKIIFNNIHPQKDSVEKNNYFIETNKSNKEQSKQNKFITNSNNIKNNKSNISKVKFNPIKIIYKTKITI